MTDKTNIFQALIKRNPNFLDRPLADLLPMRFMGEIAVNAYRGLIKRLDNLPLSLEEKESRLKDGQDAGKALLMIEARIGEMVAAEPRVESAKGKKICRGGVPQGQLPKHERLGMTQKQMRHSKEIAHHPTEVEEVIKEAEENEDIPTKTAVLNKIAYKREMERTKGNREKTRIEMAGEAYLYYRKLEDANRIIPSVPPKELREQDYLQIKAMWLLIFKKGKEFNHGANNESSTEPGRRLSQGK